MTKMLVFASVAAGAFLALPAGATTVTFEDFSGSGVSSYSSQGATFTTFPSGGTFSAAITPNGTTGLLSDASPRPPLEATLDATTDSVSVDLGDYDSDPDTLFLDIYDSGMNFLDETSLLISDADAAMHTLSLSAVGIKYAVFGSRDPSLNGSSVFADNFTFNASPAVPEPASWAMFIGGFGLVGSAMRRRGARLTFA